MEHDPTTKADGAPRAPRKRGAGRPLTLKVRVSPEEKAAIEERAAAAGRSVAAHLREAGLGRRTGAHSRRLLRADLRRAVLGLQSLTAALQEGGSEAPAACAEAASRARTLLGALEWGEGDEAAPGVGGHAAGEEGT